MRRHNDRHNVVTLFTRQRGRVAFLSTAGSSRSASRIPARLQA
ncbi:MAG: recombination protein O N-terminal domain-containing protein [Muribaculaceae bacterium]|nr:recombination protein O N-terminal domain-containing protein [Muribaculaceae bacterium]